LDGIDDQYAGLDGFDMLQDELRKIPGVDKLLSEPPIVTLKKEFGNELVTYAVRVILDKARREIFSGASAKGHLIYE